MDSEELKDKYRGGDAGKWDMQQQAQVLSLCLLTLQPVWADGETLGPGGLFPCRITSHLAVWTSAAIHRNDEGNSSIWSENQKGKHLHWAYMVVKVHMYVHAGKDSSVIYLI